MKFLQQIFLVMALLTTVSLANAVSVYTLDEQFSQTNQTVLRFRVENNSNSTLHGVELRYHVVQKTSSIANPDLYYLSGGTAYIPLLQVVPCSMSAMISSGMEQS